MSPPAATMVSSPAANRAKTLAAAGLIAVAALAAYHNSFHVPFLFDDEPAIVENATIRRLWPPWEILSMTGTGLSISGRPVANLTLAINYAVSGTDVWSYHALNLLIHILAGLALFGVTRRTLLQPVLRGRFGRDAGALALAVAVLWTVHPLQVEAVTYVIQRVESLMALFYLLTIYGFIRSADSPHPFRWHAATVAACLLGMATKEVMATAPMLVLLYDRTFVAGSWREAWRRRRWLHLSLMATWLPLLWLVAGTGWNRGGAVGWDAGGAPWAYGLTQFEAVTRYLWLSAWPHPLVFEHGTFWVHRAGEVAPYALFVVPLAAATGWALWRRPLPGFLGAWFFAILAPTSVVPGTIQMIVEHRMYLPLAAVTTLTVLGIYAAFGRRSWVMFAALALALGALTARRNEDYRSELSIWSDAVAKRPDNPRARNGLAFALEHAGRVPEAIQQFEAALRLTPSDVEIRNNLGGILDRAGRIPEAIQQYETVLRLNPKYPVAHSNLGNTLVRAGRLPEAIGQFEAALQLRPDYAEAHYNLAGALDQAGQTAAALRHYQEAVRLKPHFAAAHNNLGSLLNRLGRTPEAIAEYEEALRLQPDLVETEDNLGVLLFQGGRVAEGLAHLRKALRLQPDYARGHFNLGVALAQIGQLGEAIEQYSDAVRLQPDWPEAHNNLGMTLGQSGRLPEAIAEFRAALRLGPDSVAAHDNLGNALLQVGRMDEAIAEFEEVVRLRPDAATARRKLELIRAAQQTRKSPQ